MNDIKHHSPFSLYPALKKDNIFNHMIYPCISLAEKITGMHSLDLLYQGIKQKSNNSSDFYSTILEEMNCSLDIKNLEYIPKSGGAIIVGNHPLGGIEGIAMGEILLRVRPDIKIMANYLLGRIPEFHETMIFVDPFGTNDSKKANLKGLKEAIQWVKNGGILGIFPAGEVSHYQSEFGAIVDPEWSTTVARIAKITQAPVIPMFTKGHNSTLFQIAGFIHPRLRTLLLPHELLKLQGTSLHISFGKSIPPQTLASFHSDAEATLYCRQRTYLIEHQQYDDLGHTNNSTYMDIEQSFDTSILKEELDNLPKNQCLLESGEYQVWYSKADQTPTMLREIGRLREITFRAAGEGSGLQSDLDIFDAEYIHLFIWHSSQQIVGAYRIGQTDILLPKYGNKGLYTSTLFKYKKKFLNKISPALELGRAFVRIEFQKSYQPLLLLWKGIGAFIVANPRYRFLFGGVSISNEYTPLSKQLMITHLRTFAFNKDIAQFVKPRDKFKTKNIRSVYAKLMLSDLMTENLDSINSLLMQIESDGKGIPVLIRQYLKLNGKMIGFNRDKKFGNVIDGLIFVDLLKTDPLILARYFGDEGLESFLTYQYASHIDNNVSQKELMSI